MKLEEKRKVIEVLLCAAASRDVTGLGVMATTLVETADAFADQGPPERPHLLDACLQARKAAARDIGDTYNIDGHWSTYAQSCAEAAYRIVESSPTLRREWFGAR